MKKGVDFLQKYPTIQDTKHTINQIVILCEKFFEEFSWNSNPEFEVLSVNNKISIGTFDLFIDTKLYSINIGFQGTTHIQGWRFEIEDLNIISYYQESILSDAFVRFLNDLEIKFQIYNHINSNEL